MDIEQAIKRQALAEWRDLQILGSASLVNLVAIETRAAFETQLVDEALRESLFTPTEWANERIDGLMHSALKPELETFLAAAAEDLRAIDASLDQICEALKREDAITLPAQTGQDGELEKPADFYTATVAVGDDQSSTGLSWLTRIGGRVATGATGLATTATAAVNTVSPERLKQKTRLRSAALQRINETWVGNGNEPDAVLAQVIALIDQAAFSARTSLS